MNEPHMLPARRHDPLYIAITLSLGVLLLPAARAYANEWGTSNTRLDVGRAPPFRPHPGARAR
jgi:hypothetical protein